MIIAAEIEPIFKIHFFLQNWVTQYMKILLLEENRTNPKVNSNYSTDFPMFLLNLKCYLPEGEHLGEENQLNFCCPTYEHQTHVVYRQLTQA